VAFVAMSAGNQPKVVATTLSRETADSLIAALRGKKQMMEKVVVAGESIPQAEISVRGEPWLALLAPLKDAAGTPVGATVALASLPKQLAAYRQIQTGLLLSGVVAVLVAFAFSFAVARRTLLPVRQLVAAAEAARQGNYDQKIAADRADEVGQLGRAFDELLSDLREKRDMEDYVTELSKSLPEPLPGRPYAGHPQMRDVLLLGLELRGYASARADGDPAETLDRLSRDLKLLAAAVAARRGQVEAVVGHRVLARFEGEGRALRALGAAAEFLQSQDEARAPLVAPAAGRVAAGAVTWAEQPECALVGLPVQQLESLQREATPGEIVLSREVAGELKGAFEQAGLELAPRRALVSPQPIYVLSAAMAERLA